MKGVYFKGAIFEYRFFAYGETSLQQTPSEPQNSVRHREVSAT